MDDDKLRDINFYVRQHGWNWQAKEMISDLAKAIAGEGLGYVSVHAGELCELLTNLAK